MQAQRSDLTHEQRSLLIRRLKQRQGAQTAEILALARGEGSRFPLSFAQQRLWFLEQYAPDHPFYNEVFPMELRGSLDRGALEQALNQLVERHEILRTSFVEHEGRPVQVIANQASIVLSLIEGQATSAADRQEHLQRYGQQLAAQPFVLTQAPLLRVALLRYAPEEHVLLLVIHHIVADGWSFGIFMGELAALYTALVENRPAALPELSIQYADYAQWQREWQAGPALEQQLAYWRERLAGAPATLELASDRPRPPSQSFAGATHVFWLDPQLMEELKHLSQQERATPFMTLLSAFSILLQRFSNQDDILVGTPIANRNQAQIQRLIGYFANTLVLRSDLSGNPSFRELVRQARRGALEAYANQDVPFEKLVEELQPPRNLSHSPFFQVLLTYQNDPLLGVELPALTLTPLGVESGTAKFDLSLFVIDKRDGGLVLFEYNSALFDGATIERMAELYVALLRAAVAQPDARLSDLPALPPSDWHRLRAWEAAPAAPGADCLHQLFERQARATPQASALRHGDQSLSYAELDRRANQLAHALQGMGVSADTLVAICMERSIELMVGLLGVLKAGGAYLPLDPAYPSERLAFMLEDSGAQVVLSQRQEIERLPRHNASTLLLDQDGAEIARLPASAPTTSTTPQNAAYVIYTSGSTGRPKGVVVPHAAVANHARAIIADYQLTPADRVLQFASISFDVAVEEIIPTWLSGGCLVLRPDQLAQALDDLLAFVREERLSVLNIPTPYWHELVLQLEQSRRALPACLRLLVIGNERASPRHYALWRSMAGEHVQLRNAYGPTEATITATIYRPKADDLAARGGALPIGRPIEHVQAYLLDRQLRPVPIGVAGELYIGGAGLARGYLGRPALTAERFVPDPLGGTPGARLYRSGDMALYRMDGTLEFLGRADRQVKLRGFRVELGEIEAIVRQHPAVRDCVVQPYEQTPGQTRLAAYLAADLSVDRLGIRLPCVLEDATGRRAELTTDDISSQGVCLRGLGAPWPPEQQVLLHIRLPGRAAETSLRGQLLWQQDECAGLRLLTSPAEQALLRTSIERAAMANGLETADLRRAERRVPLRSRCILQNRAGLSVEVETENLSVGGICLRRAPTGWHPGDELELRLVLPAPFDEIKLTGAISWRDQKRAGISLTSDQQTRELLPRCLDYLIETQGFSSRHLREFLQSRLPDYMLPGLLIMLDALPTTVNGKINLRALPSPQELQPLSNETDSAPRGLTAELLAGMWADLLGLEQIGARDNFFELGGHSLIATQLVSRIRGAFSLDFPLRRIFETPTLEDLAAEIEQLRGGALWQQPAIVPARPGERLPLSFAQERLWFLDQFETGRAAYHIAGAIHLEGSLDAALLERAFNELIRRHQVLRTAFQLLDGQPLQVISPTLEIGLQLDDLRANPQEEREQELQRLATELANHPFELSRAPLLRARLLWLEETRHVLLLVLHHAIADGWSIDLLLRELVALYSAYGSGEPAALSEQPIQYADYARWQREWLQDSVLDQQLAYWKGQLAGPLPVLELPLDHPRPARQSLRGATYGFKLPDELGQAARTLSRQTGSTLFMTLLAAFQTLLQRYAGQDDLLIGIPVAGRNRLELEPLIGCFINTLVLRTGFSGDPSFAELLAQVRRITLEAHDHQELPFEKLVEALQPTRDLSHSPIFQVLFAFQPARHQAPEPPGIALSLQPLQRDTAKYDLSLEIAEEPDGLYAGFEYNRDLFEPATIQRLAAQLQLILEQVTAMPTLRISQISLLSPAERRQILLDWNATRIPYPLDQPLHQLILEQARRTPQAIALRFEQQQLSYAQLEQRASRLAQHLRALGAGPDTLVAVCMQRSLDLPVALLAVLMAGAAYVPLDPSYPAQRLEFMLQDAQPRVLITQADLGERLAACQASMVTLDTDWPAIMQAPASAPDLPFHPDQLAYMIYTSGSTGTPKGALNSHRAIVNRLLWMQQALQLTPEDRVLQKTPYSFDVSVWEFFWPLLAGASLVLALPGGHQDSGYLARLIAEAGITTLHFVPSMLQAFLDEPGISSCQSLRLVVCSGEALSLEAQQRCWERLPWASLYNLYGPTEAAVDVSVWACVPEPRQRTVPIGRPIDNLALYVLDERLEPVPVGLAGELYIGGVGLGRGYHRRPGLTAQTFVPHPHAATPGERLYRTGDVARLRADGAIEYLGRRDHQVKLRGLRIELEEIETALREQAEVRDAVVVVRDERLVAYIVAEPGYAPDQLRPRLRERLPEYMLPAAFVSLDALPLSPNGKIDRKALPAPVLASEQHGYVAPGNAVEQELAALWARLLGLAQVGVHDNFFELGGHSLLATQLISRVRHDFAVELPLSRIFEAPTIAEFAERMIQESLGELDGEMLEQMLAQLAEASLDSQGEA